MRLCGREWRAICNRTDSVSDDVYGWSVFFIHSLERVYKKSAHELHGEKETVNTCTSSGHSSGHLIGQWVCLWWYLSLHVLVSSFSGTKKQPLTVSPFFFFVPLIVSLSVSLCLLFTELLMPVSRVWSICNTNTNPCSKGLPALSHWLTVSRVPLALFLPQWLLSLRWSLNYTIVCNFMRALHFVSSILCESQAPLLSLSLRNYTFDKWTHANELTPPRAVCFIHSPDGSWVN